MKRTKQKKGNKSSKISLVLKILLLVAASLLICVTAYGIYLTKQAEYAANKSFEQIGSRQSSEKRDNKVEPIKDNVSILFVGIDDSDKRGQGAESSRTDALLLATLNNDTKTVKLLSIPRDSYVYIPEVGYKDKINHAHAFGGMLATIETVEELFDIPVDYYIRLNFHAFIDIVDALGGIEAEVPYKLRELDENDKRTINLQPGMQQLDGREALALARTRKMDTDVARGERQQEILKAIVNKAASASSILKYDDIIEAIGDNMKTDMTFNEMKAFIGYLSQGAPRIDSLTIEGRNDMSTGIYYYKLDDDSLEDVKYTLQTHLELIPDTSNVSGPVDDDPYSSMDEKPKFNTSYSN